MTPTGPGGRGTSRPRAGQPVNLWPRRIITGVALLTVIALLVAGVVHLVGAVTSSSEAMSGSGQSGATQSGGQSTAPAQSGAAQSGAQSSGGGPSDPTDLRDDDGSTPVVVHTCTASDMKADIEVQGAPTVGSGATVAITLQGPTDRECSTSTDQMSIRVLSGDQTLYDSATCESGQSSGATPLLFSPGQTWSGSLSWDGRTYDGCTAVDTDGDGEAQVAGAGTYRVRVLLGGDILGSEVVFEVR